LPSISATVASISACLASGTSRRVVMAQPCPAWEQIVKAAIIDARGTSASSITMNADLPPSSRKHFFTVALAAAMTARPVAVDPVKLIMSTSGLVTSAAPTSWLPPVSTFTTPGGMSVSSAMSLPSEAVTHGVSGGALSTDVQPAARAGASFASEICTG
jgi:hypothetical protein